METEQIFDAFGKLSKLIHAEDSIRDKQEQINSIKAKKCGNCFHWMKRSCKPEKVYGQFQSMGSPACSDFEFGEQKMLDRFETELTELKESKGLI